MEHDKLSAAMRETVRRLRQEQTEKEGRELWLEIYTTSHDQGKEASECDADATLAVQNYESWLRRYDSNTPDTDSIDDVLRALLEEA